MTWGTCNKAVVGRGVKAGLLACLTTILLLYLIRTTDLLLLGTIDFIQYWSAAKIFWQHQSNPYDLALLTQLQENITSFRPLPVVMWNPPLILPLLLPLLAAPFPYVHVLWIVCSIMAYVCSLSCLRRTLGRSGAGLRHSHFLFPFAVTFYPFILTLSYGQISVFLLCALVALLALARSDSSRGYLAGGIVFSITLCKPHLLALCYVVLVVRAVQHKRERLIMLGLLIGIASLAAVASGANSRIWSYYWQALSNPPYQWLTPTLGTWLQFLVNGHPSWSRYLPIICAVPVVGALSLFSKVDTETLLLRVIPFSLFLAPYGWVYDQVLLVPTLALEVLAILGNGRLLSLTSKILLGVLCVVVESYYLLIGVMGQEYFVFVPLCCGIILWCLRRKQRLAPLV